MTTNEFIQNQNLAGGIIQYSEGSTIYRALIGGVETNRTVIKIKLQWSEVLNSAKRQWEFFEKPAIAIAIAKDFFACHEMPNGRIRIAAPYYGSAIIIPRNKLPAEQQTALAQRY